VHHLATDLPVAEVARFADQADADLVAFSSATGEAARLAQDAARSVAAGRPRLRVLAGRPGVSLHDLLARAGHRPGPPREDAP
jgi:hypothetical protein